MLSPATLEQLALAVEQYPPREAVTTVLDDHPKRAAILDELFDARRDAWRFLVASALSGRCLDVGAGFGRRSERLAETVESVHAVDHSLDHLRIARARRDRSSAVRYVHTTPEQLPFPSTSFDTVVADLDRLGGQRSSRLAALASVVADGGSLVLLGSGWPRSTGVTARLGLESESAVEDGWAARSYRATGESLGFETVTIHALVPTADRPLYCFDVSDRGAVAELARSVRSEGGGLAGLAARGVLGLDRLGVLAQCYPSYLVVCGPTHPQPPIDVAEPLMVLGRARSVILDGTAGQVWKVPNCRANDPLVRREQRVTDAVRSRSEFASGTVPRGNLEDSPMGPMRVENRLPGGPLTRKLSADPAAAGRVVDRGLQWLARFQRSTRLERTRRSPNAVQQALSFQPADLSVPPPAEPLESVLVPVHGDYLAANILVNDGRVTGVIDWEYGALEGSPVIDAGLLVLDTVNRVVGDLETGLDRLVADAALARAIGRPLTRYAETLDLPPETIATTLPMAYSHRLAVDWRAGTTSTDSSRLEDRARAVELVVDRRDRLEQWLRECRHS